VRILAILTYSSLLAAFALFAIQHCQHCKVTPRVVERVMDMQAWQTEQAREADERRVLIAIIAGGGC